MQVEWFVNSENAGEDPLVQRLLSSSAVEQVVQRTLQAAGIDLPVTLSLAITDDEEIQTLNKEYRQQDKPTDVLSFPLLDRPLVDAPPDLLWQPSAGEIAIENAGSATEPRPAFVTPPDMQTNLGDIVISWPTVLRQAQQAGHHPTYELLYLLSHGTLHLLGYDDQTEAGYQAMVRLQESIMQEIDWEALSR